MRVESERTTNLILYAAPRRRSLLVRDTPHGYKEGWVSKRKHFKGRLIITANIWCKLITCCTVVNILYAFSHLMLQKLCQVDSIIPLYFAVRKLRPERLSNLLKVSQ